MSPETLKPTENSAQTPPQNDGSFKQLSQELITRTMERRLEILASLQPELSRKLFYSLEEKLAQEAKQLREILDWQQGRQSQLSKYTFILDPHYFEQEFLS